MALYDDAYSPAYKDESARKWFENLFMPSFIYTFLFSLLSYMVTIMICEEGKEEKTARFLPN